ncbi:gliding motility-associated C-terminal domain-containing protein [Pustulibacterium marinum]|uniref:Gliding motility-associated C-terminal domain-containing protein n=1 Tax=Pustulibacterium marinum TaxID=1224947 RepID=A0A1I7FLM1_9FLAO|nr:gliding motility-associated C-terminal domain-containing protein [Pustulibacterium marinum]SFU37119.1 gliding motility-associated C-terminal domain-containing protein [Pustulibacterium marinum]
MFTTLKRACFILILFSCSAYAQDVSLYEQFNGRYDFHTIGNTLNVGENGSNINCEILTSSSATLSLEEGTLVEAAYLYWAGSGTGDFDVQLNNTPITASRTFSDALDETRVFFAAFADVTTLVQNTGNGNYTLSNLDLTGVISPYCPTGTNFGGWAIVCVIKNENFPLQQVNVYDGLQHVPNSINIQLNGLNVYDNEAAKIGFLAWEGDAGISVNETLSINSIPVSNNLNPVDNAFNGTNSFTNSSNLYNMDIDYYDLEDFIAIGDTSLSISLTSGQDFVMVNNIVTVLASILPDATVTVNSTLLNCDSRLVQLDFSVWNTDGTAPIPVNTTIDIYADSVLLETLATDSEIAIDESLSFTTLLNIPETIPDNFSLEIVVDETNVIAEIEDNNNSTATEISFMNPPEIVPLTNLEGCDMGYDVAIFNLEEALENTTNTATFNGFYLSETDAELGINEITNSSSYQNTNQPQTIYYRYDNTYCYTIDSFEIKAINCPPNIPQGFSPNNDGINDTFYIENLWNVYNQFSLLIYNRYGYLVYKGNQSTPPWNGIATEGTFKDQPLPTGTYFYVLKLQDELYRNYTGWVYLNK